MPTRNELVRGLAKQTTVQNNKNSARKTITAAAMAVFSDNDLIEIARDTQGGVVT